MPHHSIVWQALPTRLRHLFQQLRVEFLERVVVGGVYHVGELVDQSLAYAKVFPKPLHVVGTQPQADFLALGMDVGYDLL